MAKSLVNYRAYLGQALRMLENPGLLLAAQDNRARPNTMAIGWATIGVVWGKPICVVLVRPSRYTYELIEGTGAFTVNVPTPGLADTVAYCGSVSGRSHDKFKDRGLTPCPAAEVSAPIIEECPINYECQVVHKNDVRPAELAPDIKQSAYPQGDYHRVYFGEILAVRADEQVIRKQLG